MSKYHVGMALVLLLTPGMARAQECDADCNEPETYCTTMHCYNGIQSTNCRNFATLYNTYACEDPAWNVDPFIEYPDDGLTWESTPRDGDAQDCFGNCGGGCSPHLNPCGGSPQGWRLTYEGTPWYGLNIHKFTCIDHAWRHESYMGWTATGTWTYHGWVTPGCITHDSWCPEWTILGCLLFVGCGSGWEDTWSYSEGIHAIDYLVSVENVGSC
jgi:hypothetical protein